MIFNRICLRKSGFFNIDSRRRKEEGRRKKEEGKMWCCLSFTLLICPRSLLRLLYYVYCNIKHRPLAKVLIKSIQYMKSTISYPYSLFPDFCKKSYEKRMLRIIGAIKIFYRIIN
ncbi:MAG: hypothetical protein F6K24_33865 [Okeania sp. SIO2D1]|nr:hypothetical protein [Okeania sp. SIO2D1]